MKKHTKKFLAALISTGVIASTIGATLASAASDVKVQMMQNDYVMHMFPTGLAPVYLAKVGTDKSPRYFNQAESSYYKSIVKAGNYYRDLGFVYENYTARLLYPDNSERTPYTPDTVYISISNDNGDPETSKKAGHGYVANLKGDAISELGLITIGPVDSSYMYDLSYAPDVLAHEYVHLMTQQLAGWDRTVRQSSNEAGAIVEAYSDILGELTEDNPDWKMGTSAFKYNSSKTKCYRNLKDPKATYTPYCNRTYYVSYNEFSTVKNQSFKSEIAYGGSTVLSHAAYLMTQAGLNKDIISKFWLDSISLFEDPQNPTMSNCRKAVVAAVNKYADENNSSPRGRAALLDRVNWAFNEVNVY